MTTSLKIKVIAKCVKMNGINVFRKNKFKEMKIRNNLCTRGLIYD